MVIYPAIDLINGKCVRLTQGKYDNVTVYSDNPVSMAKSFMDAGSKYIHMVDLDGAKSGVTCNFKIIAEVAKLGISVQTGGGIRDIETIERYIDSGVSRVILGTSAVNNPELVIEAVSRYDDKIAVGIDAKDGLVAVNGWEKTSSFKAVAFAKKMESIGVKYIIYTDISRDGMLKGPNLWAMREMTENLNINVIASGGVSCMEDIIALKPTGVSGVIVGKALYTGKVDLQKALENI